MRNVLSFHRTTEANTAITCAAPHLRACNLFQLSIFNSTMALGQSLAPRCPAYSIHSSVVPQQLAKEAEGMNFCMESFLRNLTETLLDSNNAPKRWCETMIYADGCITYGLSDKEAMEVRGMLGYTFNITSEMVNMLCTESVMKAPHMEKKQHKRKFYWHVLIMLDLFLQDRKYIAPMFNHTCLLSLNCYDVIKKLR